MVECSLPIHLKLKEAEEHAISSLVFSYLHIDELQTPYLIRLIAKSQLQAFQLKFCSIEVEAVREIATALSLCADMKSLKLQYCGLNSSHCFSLSQGLPGLHGLRELDLSGNDIRVNGLLMLLGGTFASLEVLVLRKCGLAAEARLPLVGILTKTQGLEVLDLADNPLTDECIAQVAWSFPGLFKLKTLNMAGTNTCTLAARTIAHSLPPALSYLDLSRNAIDDHSFITLAIALQALPFFSHLCIKGNPLTEACLHALAERAAAVIPAVEADLGVRWVMHREKCCKCGQFCLGFAEICQWLRRRPTLMAYFTLRRLRFS
jgi:hypothetical protein